MKNAEMKVVRFGESDVIATSGPRLTISGLWDDVSGNVSGISGHENEVFYVGSMKWTARDTVYKYALDGDTGSGYSGTALMGVDTSNTWTKTAFIKYNGTYEYHEAGGSGTASDPKYENAGWYKITQ